MAMVTTGALLIQHKISQTASRHSSLVTAKKIELFSPPVESLADPTGATVASRVADDERPGNGIVTEEWASRIDDPTRRRMAFAEFGRILAAENLEQALKKASTLAAGDDRRALLEGIFGQIADKDPKAAFAAAQTLTGDDRTFALKTLALEWAFNSPDGKNGSMTSTASVGVALVLATSNPEAAAAWAAQEISGREKGMTVAAIAREWAKKDPIAAATYAAQLSSEQGGGGRWAISGVIEEWAGSDPAGAAAWVATFPEGRERDWAIRQVSATWAAQDTVQAITWANGLTDPQSQRTAYTSIARAWASTDPRQALSWASQISEPAAQSSAVSAAISNWAAQDPSAAAAVIQSIGNDSTKKDAINRIAFEWARQDTAAAQAWVNSSVPPNLKEAANKAIANGQRREAGGSR